MNRWMGIVLAASGIWVCSPGSARPAADYPSRPIKVIVPWPAGGMVDTRVRRIADRLSKQVGQPVVVENRPGASGVLGMSALAKAPRDGYTIGFGSVNDLAIVQAMGISLSYDANRNLQPVTRMYVSSNLVVANAALPIHSVDDLRAYARTHRDGIRFGTFSAASTSHILQELLARWLDVPMVFVHFKGGAPMLTSLAGDEIEVGVDFAATSMPLIDAGKLRPLLVTGQRRLAMLPDVPSAAEAKAPLADFHGWGGMLAPAGTSRPIVDRLNAEIIRILRSPDLVAEGARSGIEPMPGTPEEFAAFIKAEQAKWLRLVQLTGVKAE